MPISKKQYALLGFPLANSLSPVIHKLFAMQFNLDIEYKALEVAPIDLMLTINNLIDAGFNGFNITAPYKEIIFQQLQNYDSNVRIARAVNTVVVKDDHSMCGHNTDGLGLIADFKRHNIPVTAQRILILGAGGAVRGILPELLALQPENLTIINREQIKTAKIITDFNNLGDVQLGAYSQLGVLKADVIINATSSDNCELLANLDFNNAYCYDLNYKQKVSEFMRFALDHGAKYAVNGLGMLVEQAAIAFELWHGKMPAVEHVLLELLD